MSDEELSESLAAAVADHASIDWRQSSERLQAADPELVHSLQVISAIGEARRARVVADQTRSARVLRGLSLAVATITIVNATKLGLRKGYLGASGSWVFLVVLVFATPQLCQSRVCGPVEDVVEQVKSETKRDMAFIHNEVYVDNNPNKGIRPQLTAYGLQTEPWTFVIDKTGKVVERFEGALSVDELKQAVAKVS